ncbi:MAG: hypothetical protein HY513_00230 [Candidatus Aenigmarchaeota archaeon]|nr:hypothetical protein [Candidatus Aenigmarchaeota archaeon]
MEYTGRPHDVTRCRMLTDFLEAAALVHYRLNMDVPAAQGSKAQQIKERFPDKMEVVKRGENIEPRVASAGKVLDEQFEAIASRYKKVVHIDGFDFPSAWHDDAALRCLANVTWRE